MSDEKDFCRLCAMQTLPTNLKACDSVKVTAKLKSLNVDVSFPKTVPCKICFKCLRKLNKTCCFVHIVRAVQEKILPILLKKHSQKNVENTNTLEPNKSLKDLKPQVIPDKDSPNDIETKSSGNGDNKSASVNSDPPSTGVNEIESQCKNNFETSEICSNKTENCEKICQASDQDTWSNLACKCGRCDAEFQNIIALQKHSIEAHNQCCIFKCSVCNKIFEVFTQFLGHLMAHDNMVAFCCEFCNKIFRSPLDCNIHIKAEETNSSKAMCPNCGTTFKTVKELRSQTPPEAKKKKKKEVIKDPTGQGHQCYICHKTKINIIALKMHLATHDATKMFICHHCSSWFNNRRNLKDHLVALGIKKFDCKDCGKSFRYKHRLGDHYLVHTDEKPYTCEYCYKVFRFKNTLNVHKKVHMTFAPYRCTHCNSNFSDEANLKKHMLKQHTVDRATDMSP